MGATGWRSPVVGVLGGLGPGATVTFLDQLVRFTRADNDQGHIDAIVTQHSSTPDRSQAILHPSDAPDPTAQLVADATLLTRAGADLLVSPCNTLHYFLPAIRAKVSVPFLSIIDITARRAVAVAGARPIAVFATEGTVAAGLYQSAIAAAGGLAWTPPPTVQADITTIIDAQVKAGRPVDVPLFERCVTAARDAGARLVVLGCTELSVVYDQQGWDVRDDLVDSLRALVYETITSAGRQVRL